MSKVAETSSNGAPAAKPEQLVGVQLSVTEAEALRAWLMKPAADGTTALDDSLVKTAIGKLSGALDKIQAIATVRRELEEAGFQAGGLSDEQIVELGSRISQTSLHRLA